MEMMMAYLSSVLVASSSVAATSNLPFEAWKFLRRKCQPDCIFAPYFPPYQPQKFAHMHKVFGTSNVTKLFNELNPYQREDAVNSHAYKTEMHLCDPVYGYVGTISILQHQLRKLQMDLTCARAELSKYQTSTYAPLVEPAEESGTGLLTSMSATHSPNQAWIRKWVRERTVVCCTCKGATPHDDVEMGVRLGANGAYDAGFVVTMNVLAAAAVSIGPLVNQLPKTRTT